MIIPVSLALIAILLGYVFAAGSVLGATLAIGAAAPHFVEEKHCLRVPYKLTEAVVWMLCTALGAFVMAWVGDRGWAWLEGLSLIGVLVTVLWRNTWEARQRGLAFQILLTALTPLGVAAGYMLRG